MTVNELINLAWAMADLMPDVTAAQAYEWLRTLRDAPNDALELCEMWGVAHGCTQVNNQDINELFSMIEAWDKTWLLGKDNEYLFKKIEGAVKALRALKLYPPQDSSLWRWYHMRED